jgi:hypothetical protein
MRTARSITSGENFGDFLMLAPFSIEGASSKTGAVQDSKTAEGAATVESLQFMAHDLAQGMSGDVFSALEEVADAAVRRKTPNTKNNEA